MASDKEQAMLLERFCDDLALDPQIPAPAELDAALVATAQRLYGMAEVAEPSAAFASRLEQRLAAQPAQADASGANRTAPLIGAGGSRLPLMRNWLPRLATAAMLLLLTAGATLLAGILSGRNPGLGANPTPTVANLPSIDQIRNNAQAALDGGAITSFALTETFTVSPSGSLITLGGKMPNFGPNDGNTTGTRFIWFQSPNLWRIESKGSDSRDQQTKPLPQNTLEVSDGTTLWNYDDNGNVTSAAVNSLNNPKGSQRPIEGVLGDDYALPWLTNSCYRPSVYGSDTVAGRAAYIINLGGYFCFADTTTFPFAVWIDQQTYFVLKVEYREITGFSLRQATDIQYNIPLDKKLFSFEPPSGVNVKNPIPLDQKANTQQKLDIEMFQAAASALGLSSDELTTELAKGATVLSIAQSKGISEQQIKDAIIATIRPSLDELVKAGVMTASDEENYIAKIQSSDLSQLVPPAAPDATPSVVATP